MKVSNKLQVFKKIDENSAYIVHAITGSLLRDDNNPILFIAGENDKYKFLLRSAFMCEKRRLNILLMAVNEIVTTPQFTLSAKLFGDDARLLGRENLILCEHSSSVMSSQHFHCELDTTIDIANKIKKYSLRIDITGSVVPFHVWTPEAMTITTTSDKVEVIFGC